MHGDLAARCVLCGAIAVALIYHAEGVSTIFPVQLCTYERMSASADYKEDLVGLFLELAGDRRTIGKSMDADLQPTNISER